MAKTTQLSFTYGDTRLYFERSEKQSANQKLTIKVHSDCHIEVLAPADLSDKDVLDGVKKRARWIYNKVGQFQIQLEHITPRQYISGESHYYLGKQYMLRVIEDNEARPQVKLLRGKLEVTVRKKSAATVKTQLLTWYKDRAREVFLRQLNKLMPQVLWTNELPSLRFQVMKKQWGSCSPKGTITLNPLLVKAPSTCIDYVILHELCHLEEHNHSKRFYRLLSQVIPDWQVKKDRLDAMANRYLS